MNKRELASRMSQLSKLNREVCSKAIAVFMEVVRECYLNDEPLGLTGFGTFLPLYRKARIGVNPATKEKINIPSSKKLKFRPSKNI